MLNDIFCFLRSILSPSRQETPEEFIEKFANATPITADKVRKLGSVYGWEFIISVRVATLVDLYGTHLALQSQEARKLLENTNITSFEKRLLSQYLGQSLKSIGVNGNVENLYADAAKQIRELDTIFSQSLDHTNGPYWAATKRLLKIVTGNEILDVAVLVSVSGEMSSIATSTTQMFHDMYENGFRW